MVVWQAGFVLVFQSEIAVKLQWRILGVSDKSVIIIYLATMGFIDLLISCLKTENYRV